MTTKTRTAEAGDLDAMRAINNAAVPHVNGLSRRQFADLQQQAVVCRVAAIGPTVAGFILALDHRATYSSENYQWFVGNLDRFLYVDRIAVDARHRGAGMGRALYRALFADAVRLGLGVVACEVNLHPPNPLSLEFHKALGFQQVAELQHVHDEKVVALLTVSPATAARPPGLAPPRVPAPGRLPFDHTMKTSFRFIRNRRYEDAGLQLVLAKTTPADPVKRYVPGYEFDMREKGSTARIGSIRLRIGRTRPLTGWCGHIGYGVDEKARGKRYAARSCLLLFPLALAHGLRTIWITCDPRNTASRRTCEIAGGRYVNTVRVPKGTEMYEQGRRWVRRYRFDLERIVSDTASHNAPLSRRNGLPAGT